MDLVDAVYQLTTKFPKTEVYGLSAQMRRGAISIASNIAEGKRRGTRKDYRHFLYNSFGSGAELETQLEIAKRQKYCKPKDYIRADTLLDEIMKMLNAMIAKLS